MSEIKRISDADRVKSLRAMEQKCRNAEEDWNTCKEATKAAKEAFDVAVAELRQGITDEDLPLFTGDDE